MFNFKDEFTDEDLSLNMQDTVYYAVNILREQLIPESFDEEKADYEQTLDFLNDKTIDLNIRFNKAIVVLEILNIYKVD